MRKSYLFSVVTIALVLSTKCIAQPYSGTIFIDPDIITAADTSTFVSSTYTGQGMRIVYDRRVSDWVTINAYLFDIVWDDGLTSEAQINPEFGSVAAAGVEAEKYGIAIGRLPTSLRQDVEALWIHKGTEPFGGGNNSILIHTGQSALYEQEGILEETLVHEASHTSLDADHALATEWLEAQTMDPTFISTYAASNPTTEDVAESFLTWIAVRQCEIRISQNNFNIITETIPNRITYFDNQDFDMYPLCMITTSLDEAETNPFLIYPNPSTDVLNILASQDKNLHSVEIFDLQGKLILTERLNTLNHTILTHDFSNGVYLLIVTSEDGSLYAEKWIKN